MWRCPIKYSFSHWQILNSRGRLSLQAGRRHTRIMRSLAERRLNFSRLDCPISVGGSSLWSLRRLASGVPVRNRSSLWSIQRLHGLLIELSMSEPSRTGRQRHSSAMVRQLVESPGSVLVQLLSIGQLARRVVELSCRPGVGNLREATIRTEPLQREEFLPQWRFRKRPAPSRPRFQEWLRTAQPIEPLMRRQLRLHLRE